MPSHLSSADNAGEATTSAATPPAAASSIVEKPKGTPAMCGSVAANPWFAPVAVAIALFGPGVNDPTSAKTIRASN
jgi:hypothetical protein